MIRVQVGIDDVRDAVLAFLGKVEIRMNLALRVDDDRLTRLAGRDEIRGTPGLVVQELFEVHGDLAAFRARF